MLYEKTLQLLLESVGRPEEVDYYLKRFKNNSKSDYFALIVPERDVLQENFEHLTFSLEMLFKLELFPIVLIAFPDPYVYKAKFINQDMYVCYFLNNLNENHLIVKNNNKKILVIFFTGFLIDFINHFNHFLPDRVHFVRNQGFIKDRNQQYLYMLDALTLKEPEKKKIELLNPKELESILEEDIGIYIYASYLYANYNFFHISITSPFMLLKELFTIKGSGTLIRKPSKIRHIKREQVTDSFMITIKNIIEECFQKKLKDQALQYFTDVFIDSEEKSLILLEKKEFGYYLSKFAVTIEARGRGIAQDLWNELQKKNFSLFWKTNQKNSIKKWYEKISDGFCKLDPYLVFWKNISYTNIPRIIDFIKERGSDFYED